LTKRVLNENVENLIFSICSTVDNAVPGDVVKICGVVKVSDADENKSRSKEKSMFLLYIFANSVENCKESQKTADDGSDIVTEFTLKVNDNRDSQINYSYYS
jgi:DNA replicative helicase MCM subunit Mcm2 (Cdc46/Mcm family)